MARPPKQGLSYFSFDVGFYGNMKIRKIMNACGPNSGTILTCLLCNIYKDKGYYILWDGDLPFFISDQLVGVTEGAVLEVLKKAVQVEFFNKKLYDQYKILTSVSIQERFKEGTTKRVGIEIDNRYWIYDSKNKVSDGKNPVPDTGSTQTKLNETKPNEINSSSAAEISPPRQKNPMQVEAIAMQLRSYRQELTPEQALIEAKTILEKKQHPGPSYIAEWAKRVNVLERQVIMRSPFGAEVRWTEDEYLRKKDRTDYLFLRYENGLG